MQKFVHLLLTGLTIVVLTACGGSSSGDDSPTPAMIEILEDILGNANGTPATAEQINSLPGVDGAVEGVDYSAALAAGTYADPENPTAEEIQAVVDDVNSGTTPPANQDVGAVTDNNAAANTAAENAAVGAVVGITAQATDPDSADTVTYTLTVDAGGLFAINGTSGVVTVAAGLDYETATTHSITVLATSSDSSTSTKVMTIAVTNVVDVVATLANSTATIGENAADGDTVGTVTVSDNGDSAITDINLSGTGAENFAVATDGAITVAAGASLDFETVPSYSLTAVATNGAGDSTSVTVDITVTDTADIPATLANSTGTVAEDAADGTAVGTVTISDNGDAAITAITLSGTGNENFAVATDGAITVAAGASLDFESTPSYSLTAVATNGAGDSASVTVDITVTNVAEVATLANSTGTVAEDAADGAAVGTVTISDAGDSAITAITLNGTGAANFAVATDGAITVAAGASLDFESTPSYSLTAVATNAAGDSASVTVGITVTNVAEVATLANSTGSIDENSAAGAAVGAITITDGGDSAITAITLSGTGEGNFTVATDGNITVKAGATLDYETTGTYNLTAVATNAAGDSDSVDVTIAVNDIVEVATFTINAIADADVVESATYNGPAAVTSGDDPIGDVTYELGGADALDFSIDDATGEVSMTAPGFATTNDADGDYVYEVSITATDADGNSDSEDWTVTVTHTDGYRVISYGSQRWLDRNVGANDICDNVVQAENDPCMGYFYQWGRLKDGHQIRTSDVRHVLSSNTNPGHNDFIATDNNTTTNPSLNWLDHNETDLWQDAGSTNNGVCPTGWSVPTKADFEALSLVDASDAFSKINLHTSGYRNDEDGVLAHDSEQRFGFYWTSTVVSGESSSLRLDKETDPAAPGGLTDSFRFADYGRANGFPVRCIKD